uniref:Uncharacterized protein n=1 Tax=Fagus sylvatica TaxID=28930 RepID=A0A2N9FN33_FAGSY
MEDGGKSLSDHVHKMPFGRIFGYSNNPPETSKGEELVEEKAKMENDPKKDQEASENEFSETLLNLMLRWLAFLILIPAFQYFSSPSAILILSGLNLVFVFYLFTFPVNEKTNQGDQPENKSAVEDEELLEPKNVVGDEDEELLKPDDQNSATKIWKDKETLTMESDKGEEPMKGKTTVQAELPQDDKDGAEDKANDKWEEEMLEEESSHNGSDSISDSSEDVELMEIDRHGNPSDSSNDELKCLTCEIEARVKMQQEYGDLLDKVHAYEEDSRKWEEEKLELNAKLTAITNRNQLAYESNVDCRVRDIEERSTISAKLVVAIESSMRYKARLLDSEETCHTLKKQNANLSTKLLVETSSVEYLQKRVHEFEEKCRVLEAEKNDLTTKLCTTTASSELYQSLLRNLNC